MEKRRSRRFRLTLPVEITQISGKRVSRLERTIDISSNGALFTSCKEADIGGRIEYTITLTEGKQIVRLRCLGKVVRVERCEAQAEGVCQIAATIDRYEFQRMES